MTTMVLTYTYGAPARWVARIDPPNTKAYQLSVMFDNTKLEVATADPGTINGVIYKFPFTPSGIPSVVVNGGVVTVKGDNTNVNLSSGDVDIFEILFKEIGSARPGQLASVFTENFDGVVAPALPPGWTASNSSGPAPLWVTSNSGTPAPPADSAPNAAFIDDPATVSDKRLDSTSIGLPDGAMQLNFRQNYALQSTFDGGVLEISIGGGAFADIIAAGGSFVTGGYNATLSSSFGNPLGGRMAWTGATGGFITTIVNLPAAAQGQSIVLRWRMGSDTSVAGQGWIVDSVNVASTPPQPPFTVFANPAAMPPDYLEAVDPLNPGTIIHFDAAQIGPTTRTFTPGVFPHIWDPDTSYNNGHTGGPGTWDTSSNSWDDLPSAIPGPPPPFHDTPWNNGTHPNDIAVFGGDPGSGIVTLAGPISVGGFQFDISGYDIQGGTLTLSSSPSTPSVIDTGANNASISSTIAGNGFTKIGSGTLRVTGANAYNGGTIVNNGTLLVNNSSGSGTGLGPVIADPGPAMASLAVVGGTGTIAGAVTIAPNATLLAGNGMVASGALTITNNLGLSPNSIIKLALGSGGNHSTLVRGAGTWTFDPNQGFTLITLGAQPGFYSHIITGLASDPGVGSWHINNPGFIGTFSYDGAGNIGVNLTSVPPSSNADLSDLAFSAGPISSAFDPNTTSYTLIVPFSTNNTTVTPTAADAGATITVNGNPVPSGNTSGPILLNVGNNVITTTVTAADSTTMKTYTVNVIRSANVTVTGSTGADGEYGTLKAAFDALNANGTQAGNVITVSIKGDTSETAVAALSQPSVSSWTSLTITPIGTRTVSGSLATPLIDLAGADNVTIDGLNAAGNSLTVSNTSTAATAGTSTIRFINGATNNLVQNCTILGSSTAATAVASGNVLFSTSTVAGGNSNNTITGNNIGPAGSNLPSKCVMSLGSASPNANTGNIINNNNIFDFFSPTTTVAGINIQTNNATVTISNNRLYQTASRAFTGAALTYNGILVTPGAAGSATITGNTIGFGAANGTGTTTISGSTNRINGIAAPSTSTAVVTSVQGNTVSGINQTTSQGTTGSATAFIGISVGATAGLFDIGSTAANNIGSLDGSSSIVLNNTTTNNNSWGGVGIFDFSFQTGDVISNNRIGTITINNGGTGTGAGFRGIRLAGTTGQNVTINNNVIGGAAAGSITDNVVGTYNMYGLDNASANLTATGNVIRNISGNAQAAGFIGISGIIITAVPTGVSTISQNTIHSLSDNAGAANSAIYALYGNFPATANVVERNFVHSLSITSTNLTSQLAGIIAAAGSATYKNNMVRLGVDASGASITPGYVMYGMFEIAGTNNVYFNSFYVGGSGVASFSNTFGFVSNVTTNIRNYFDNIFWNARNNASGGGKNYVIAVGGTTPNPAGLTSNYNDLFASGTGGFVGLFNATDQPTLGSWGAATGQDAISISANPLFANPVGTAATVNLHIACVSPAINSGTPIAGITTDFDNDTRNATTPAIGADELTLISPTAVNAVSSKVHGGAGIFNINLPFAGPAGIESRSSGGAHQIVFTFSGPVNVGSAVVSSGIGSVAMFSGNGTNTITVNLTGVANAQYITVTLNCVDDGVNVGPVSVTMGVLVGDRTANGSVTGSDVSAVKLQSGSAVDGINFRSDMNVSGTISGTDVSITKLASGTALPP